MNRQRRRFFVNNTLILLMLLFVPQRMNGIKWLSIYKLPLDLWSSDPSKCPRTREERREYGMVTAQTKLCRKMPQLMPAIFSAAGYAVDCCQKTFADRRWNCSSIKMAPNLQMDLTGGTKEQAFLFALSAAALTHQVAKACISGDIPNCPCGYGESSVSTSTSSNSIAKNAEDSYKWKGCSDNVVYGKRISREWGDSVWRRTAIKKPTFATAFSPSQPDFSAAQKKNNEEENTLKKRNILSAKNHHSMGGKSDSFSYFTDSVDRRKTPGAKIKMNQHNSDVGRQLTEQSLYRKCKCHGVSSSCDVRTCWYTLPPLEEIAERLKESYNVAKMISPHFVDDQVKIMDVRMLRTTSSSLSSIKQNLVYLRSSSDYCEENLAMGSFGTHMRQCNTTSTGPSSCESLCCGRGFNTKQVRIEEQCHCKYIHCCYIKCKKCVQIVDKHYCK